MREHNGRQMPDDIDHSNAYHGQDIGEEETSGRLGRRFVVILLFRMYLQKFGVGVHELVVENRGAFVVGVPVPAREPPVMAVVRAVPFTPMSRLLQVGLDLREIYVGFVLACFGQVVESEWRNVLRVIVGDLGTQADVSVGDFLFAERTAAVETPHTVAMECGNASRSSEGHPANAQPWQLGKEKTEDSIVKQVETLITANLSEWICMY